MIPSYLYVFLFHILVVGPLLVYTGTRLTNEDKMLKSILIILGGGVIVYHSYKFYSLYPFN